MSRYRAPCPVTNEPVNGLISANMRPFVPGSFKFPDRIPIAIDTYTVEGSCLNISRNVRFRFIALECGFDFCTKKFRFGLAK